MNHDSIPTGSQPGICGSWTGHFCDRTGEVASYGMIHFLLESNIGQLVGHGSYCAGKLQVLGKEEAGGKIALAFSGLPDDPDADRSFSISFQGEIHAQTVDDQSRISGGWMNSSASGTLVLTQLPTWVYQLKLELAPSRSPRSLLKFALSAVRSQVRLQRGQFPVAKIMEIRRGAELTRYQYLLGDLDPKDKEEFQRLLRNSTPWDARIYRCAARTTIDCTLHR